VALMEEMPMCSTQSARVRRPILPALLGVLVTMSLLAATPALAEISVGEFGVGTAIEQRELKGKAESFPEGSKVFFWTRVLGGADGDRIHHVSYRNWVRSARPRRRFVYP